MSRPRLQSDDVVLDKALEVFWTRGFAATSIRDISDACGLGVAALYNRYTNKDGIFVAALNRYADQGLGHRLERLSGMQPPLRAIRTFFDELVDGATGASRGCLLVNTALDGGELPEAATNLVRSRLTEVEAFFAGKLREARNDGTVPKTVKPAEVAESLLGTMLAILVLARVDPDPRKLRRLGRIALTPITERKTKA